MQRPTISLDRKHPLVVASCGDLASFQSLESQVSMELCDVCEVRLDLLGADGSEELSALLNDWRGMPLLFTARSPREGGSGNLSLETRSTLLATSLAAASMIDVEVASIAGMQGILKLAAEAGVPWMASFHDFDETPDIQRIQAAEAAAFQAGAAGFKLAAKLNRMADLTAIVTYQASEHALPVATMGMGPLGPVSRLLCAQYGSVLNYGSVGKNATAPGQWDCGFLKDAIRRVEVIGSDWL